MNKLETKKVGGTQDEVAELLMDILNDVYTVEDCLKDIKEYLK